MFHADFFVLLNCFHFDCMTSVSCVASAMDAVVGGLEENFGAGLAQ